MLKVDWSDVLGVLQTCKPYLIAIAAVILVAVAVIIAVRKVKKPLRYSSTMRSIRYGWTLIKR